MAEEHWISDSDWQTIVEHVPIVSVDLVVFHEGSVLLGKRKNKPAKGEWFVPGGRVNKGETRVEAVHRIAQEELGVDVEIVEPLGAFEHIYETADVETSDGKHYLANGYVVKPLSTDFEVDPQHSDFAYFDEPPTDPHEYIELYFSNSTALEEWWNQSE